MRYYENNLPNWLTGPSRTRRLHSAKARLNILGNNQEVAPSEPSGRGEQDGALSAVEWYNLNDPRSNISFKKGGARPPEVPVFKPAQTLKEHIHEMMDGGISLLLFPAGRSYAYWAGEDDAPEYILEHDRCDRVNEVLGYGWARVEKATKSNSNHITGMKPGHENEREYEKDHDGQRQDQAEREVSRDESDEEGESEITSEEKGGDEGAGEGDDEGSDDEEEYEGDSEDCEEDEGEWEEDDGEEEERVDYREDEEEEEESDEDA